MLTSCYLEFPRKWLRILAASCLALICITATAQANAANLSGTQSQWHPLTVDFNGPFANETDDSPNPFLDYRLVVEFTSPGGSRINVPGFFAGNGNGNGSGNVWRVKFAPGEPGNWQYRANFKEGRDLSIDLDLGRGNSTHFDGESGSFQISGIDPSSQGFLKWGHLDYVGEHYLKFRNGPYWLKTGTDSPENFLAYAGFDNTSDRGGVYADLLHFYEPHRQDFRAGDPLFASRDSGVDSRGIIGALNYLSDSAVNSIYFLPMNLGGDGYDTHPFLAPERTPYFKTHFDISKLDQWDQVLNHAQNRGIALNVVLNETEIENREWHDNGAFGNERRLYYREMVARFGYLLAAKWNISEENNFPVDFVREAAFYLSALDWNAKPISIHTPPDRFENYFAILGNPLLTATSIQYNVDRASEYVEEWRQRSRDAGVPWVIDMDENDTGLLDRNADDLRRRVLYDVLFSGGNIEWYFGFARDGGDISVEDFRSRQAMWNFSRHAREFMQRYLPFNRMQPMDNLVSGENQDFGGAEVFALPGEIYAVYLPNASADASLATAGGNRSWQIRWFNPVNGQLEKTDFRDSAGQLQIGRAPSRNNEDWIVLIDNGTAGNNDVTVNQNVDNAPGNDPVSPPSPESGNGSLQVVGNQIIFANDDWYQVQRADNFEPQCEGRQSCSVSEGTYNVINLTTGERTLDVLVQSANGELASDNDVTTPFRLEGNRLVFNNGDWYQVQNASSFASVCEGRSGCDLSTGQYNIINLTTGQRYDGDAGVTIP